VSADQQILSELSTALQWISRLQSEVAPLVTAITGLQDAAHRHTLSLLAIDAKLTVVLASIKAISGPTDLSSIQATLEELKTMSDTLDTEVADLTAKVTEQTQVNQSALTLINGFSARLDAAVAAAKAAGATDAQLSALHALSSTIASNDQQLAAAVAANADQTPAAPTP
jgi:predicted  nucleic acid-binding Zn-ribbon protein